jgi:hypothetical protein
MKKFPLFTLTALAAMTLPAFAGVSAEEASQLGKTLTPMGAIKAGNADGSIPAYTGGLTKPPAGYTKGGEFIDPHASEKPIFKIDASNVDKYSSKLSEGLILLIKTKPGFYINVYKTHRDYAYPKAVEEGTVKNATNAECKTFNEGDSLEKACRGGYPFPIPKTGKELMWNKLINYAPPSRTGTANWLVDASGNPILTSKLETYRDNLNYFSDPSSPRTSTDNYSNLASNIVGPNRLAGAAQGQSDYLDPIKNPKRSWSYSPGQRRVRMAPEFSYDTPHSTLGGGQVYDEVYLFSGAMDRFDFKLLGKKEMFIPANNHELVFGSNPACMNEKPLQKTHLDPECVRFELRRVWDVEATLKPGKRHIYSKRKWLIEEDSYTVGTYESWDQSNKPYRIGMGFAAQVYETENVSVYSPGYALYDMQKNMYLWVSAPFKKPVFGNPMKEIDTQPEAVAARSAR